MEYSRRKPYNKTKWMHTVIRSIHETRNGMPVCVGTMNKSTPQVCELLCSQASQDKCKTQTAVNRLLGRRPNETGII